MKANEQKSGHNGAETIYNGCGGGKSEEGVIDGRNRRGGAETLLDVAKLVDLKQ